MRKSLLKQGAAWQRRRPRRGACEAQRRRTRDAREDAECQRRPPAHFVIAVIRRFRGAAHAIFKRLALRKPVIKSASPMMVRPRCT